MRPPLTLDEQKQFYEDVKYFSEFIRQKMTPEVVARLETFVQDTAQTATGKFDRALMTHDALEAIKRNRINLTFWRKQAQNILLIKTTAEEYVEDKNRINVKSIG